MYRLDCSYRLGVANRVVFIINDRVFRRRTSERTPEDLELIYEELCAQKALAHLPNSVKRELASVVVFEAHPQLGHTRKSNNLSNSVFLGGFSAAAGRFAPNDEIPGLSSTVTIFENEKRLRPRAGAFLFCPPSSA